MLAANLVLLGLGIAFLVVAVRGLSGSWPMIVASLATLALWVVIAVWAATNLLRAFSDAGADEAVGAMLGVVLVGAPVTGIGLAFLAFVKCGPVSVPRSFHALGLAAQLTLVVVLLLGGGSTASAVIALVVLVAWGVLWLVFYLLLRGRVDAAAYATAPASFRLPFPSGARTWVIQGNNSRFNHTHANLTQDFAWDFRRPCGTPVLAALAGTVTRVIDTNDGIGGSNNEIEVQHADGSVASYLHILHNSAQVVVGGRVAQGDRLASVGSVGNSLTGHIHFHVRQGADTIPVKFADVTRHDGIPRGFRFYTSGNP
ncbi:MAG: M23 family metallopeptidase [Propionibacteriaceae bacterium]|nr:M23 family metallopeptidase [Propionibacteriaceae bacterium]